MLCSLETWLKSLQCEGSQGESTFILCKKLKKLENLMRTVSGLFDSMSSQNDKSEAFLLKSDLAYINNTVGKVL